MSIRRFTQIILVIAVIVTIMASATLARNVNASAGTSGFSFLKINVGARAVAMGGAFTGLADDESSLYYNPAGIAALEGRRFIAGYHNYFVDLQSGVVGFIRSLNDRQTLAFHVSYLNYGEFTHTDRQGNINGTFGGSDILFATTFAMQYTHELLIGATGKLIYEKIQDYSATGLALDIGVKYSTNRGRYTGGLMIQNLGTQLSSLGEVKDGLPTTLRGGGSVRPKGLPVLISGDIIMPFDNDLVFAFGAEYSELKPLHFRLGWNSFGSNYRADGSSIGLAGSSVGLGIDYKSVQFSYAFAPAADLGESHRITVTGSL